MITTHNARTTIPSHTHTMTTTIKTTTTAHPRAALRHHRPIESLHTYHVLGRAEGPVRAHRNVTLGNLHHIRRTHITVSTPARRNDPQSPASSTTQACVSLPSVSLARRRSRRAYLGRARLLDARTGGVGGLGGNHGVGLGNHRRRVTSRRACVSSTMDGAGAGIDSVRFDSIDDATRF